MQMESSLLPPADAETPFHALPIIPCKTHPRSRDPGQDWEDVPLPMQGPTCSDRALQGTDKAVRDCRESGAVGTEQKDKD